jgi:hypothetical protein
VVSYRELHLKRFF